MIADSGGLRLWSESFGDPGDPPVLLVMGTSFQGVDWDEAFVERLVAGHRFVIRFDHRDVGASDVVDIDTHPYTSDEMALDALAVLDAHELDSAHLVGVSLGGVLAQWLAVHRPQRVRSVTAISTTRMDHDPTHAWRRAMQNQDPDPDDLPPPSRQFLTYLMLRGNPQSREERVAVAIDLKRILGGHLWSFDAQRARQAAERGLDRARDPDAGDHHASAGMVMTEARRATVSNLAAPLLVVHGDQDPLYPPEHGRALASAVPDSRLAVIEGMGHGVSQPQAWPKLVSEILDHTARAEGFSDGNG